MVTRPSNGEENTPQPFSRLYLISSFSPRVPYSRASIAAGSTWLRGVSSVKPYFCAMASKKACAVESGSSERHPVMDMAPWLRLSDISGIIIAGSILCSMPSPVQAGHAP